MLDLRPVSDCSDFKCELFVLIVPHLQSADSAEQKITANYFFLESIYFQFSAEGFVITGLKCKYSKKKKDLKLFFSSSL